MSLTPLEVRAINDRLYIDLILASEFLRIKRLRPSTLDMQMIEKAANDLTQAWVEGGGNSDKNPHRYLKWAVTKATMDKSEKDWWQRSAHFRRNNDMNSRFPHSWLIHKSNTVYGRRQGALLGYPNFQSDVTTSIQLAQSPYSVTTYATWELIDDARGLIDEIGSNPRPGIEIDIDNMVLQLKKAKDTRYSVWNAIDKANFYLDAGGNGPLPPIANDRPDTGIKAWWYTSSTIDELVKTLKDLRSQAIVATTDRIVREGTEETLKQAEDAGLINRPGDGGPAQTAVETPPIWSRPEFPLIVGGAVLALVVVLKRR